jgi:acetyl-CoA carboxylase carboxyl transferase subunit alpha
MMQNMRKSLQEALDSLHNKPVEQLLGTRFERLMGYGKFRERA